MIGTITNTNDNRKILAINFDDAELIRGTFGRNDDICDVNETIQEVKELFEIQIQDFDFPEPSASQIRVDYVDEPVDIINITWPGNIRDLGNEFVALNQPHRANIFMTYPIKDNIMTAEQLLSHELGHWFFNRMVEDRIGADNRHVTRSDIHGYENGFTEKAAYYCEIMVAGNRQGYHPNHNSILTEVRQAIIINQNYLSNLLQECLNAPRD